MKPLRITLTLAAIALALVVAMPAAFAQDGGQADKKLYPDTNREEPTLDLRSQAVADKLNKGLMAVNAGNAKVAEASLIPLSKKSDSRYAQALALQGLGNLRFKQGKVDKAIDLMKHSLAIGIMPNDTYFQVMYALVQFYIADEQYQKALDLLHKWRQQGKRITADSYGLEGNIQYDMGHYKKAIAAIKKAKQLNAAAGKTKVPDVWSQILSASYAQTGNASNALAMAKKRLAKNPTDLTTMRNAVSVLIGAGRYSDAIDLMQIAYKKGALQSGEDYINMAKLYMMVAQNSKKPKPKANKAREILQEGLATGKIKQGYKVYKLAGDAAMIAYEPDKALASYKKAAPYAQGGALDVRMGQILANRGEYERAIHLIESGLDKGVEEEGQAYYLLGAINANAKNQSAAYAAMRKATQYPATKKRAEAWLRDARNG